MSETKTSMARATMPAVPSTPAAAHAPEVRPVPSTDTSAGAAPESAAEPALGVSAAPAAEGLKGANVRPTLKSPREEMKEHISHLIERQAIARGIVENSDTRGTVKLADEEKRKAYMEALNDIGTTQRRLGVLQPLDKVLDELETEWSQNPKPTKLPLLKEICKRANVGGNTLNKKPDYEEPLRWVKARRANLGISQDVQKDALDVRTTEEKRTGKRVKPAELHRRRRVVLERTMNELALAQVQNMRKDDDLDEKNVVIAKLTEDNRALKLELVELARQLAEATDRSVRIVERRSAEP